MRLLQVYSEYQRRRVGSEGDEAGMVSSVREARDAVLEYRAAYLQEVDWDGGLIRFWAAVEARSLRCISEVRGGV